MGQSKYIIAVLICGLLTSVQTFAAEEVSPPPSHETIGNHNITVEPKKLRTVNTACFDHVQPEKAEQPCHTEQNLRTDKKEQKKDDHADKEEQKKDDHDLKHDDLKTTSKQHVPETVTPRRTAAVGENLNGKGVWVSCSIGGIHIAARNMSSAGRGAAIGVGSPEMVAGEKGRGDYLLPDYQGPYQSLCQQYTSQMQKIVIEGKSRFKLFNGNVNDPKGASQLNSQVAELFADYKAKREEIVKSSQVAFKKLEESHRD